MFLRVTLLKLGICAMSEPQEWSTFSEGIIFSILSSFLTGGIPRVADSCFSLDWLAPFRALISSRLLFASMESTVLNSLTISRPKKSLIFCSLFVFVKGYWKKLSEKNRENRFDLKTDQVGFFWIIGKIDKVVKGSK